MTQQGLLITIGDGQTVYAMPEPEDQRDLAQLLGDRSTIELADTDQDLEGHAISDNVLVDVEGHALTLRLPNAGDAAALRRALAVGAVTATIVGAGAIAALQNQAPADVQQAPARAYSQQVPAQAQKADAANALREQGVQQVSAPVYSQEVPAQAQKADAANALREQGVQQVSAPVYSQEVPAQAQKADAANALREQSLAGSPAGSQASGGVTNSDAAPAPAEHADAANTLREQQFTDNDS